MTMEVETEAEAEVDAEAVEVEELAKCFHSFAVLHFRRIPRTPQNNNCNNDNDGG